MSVHKVPQDVEADDKLIGPFSFKQFIFILIAVGMGWVAYMMAQVSTFLVIIPLPFILVFVILGLPLRKDQPTDVYVAALINFWLRPKTRIWGQEGMLEHVQITAPKKKEVHYTDGLSRHEVKSRLNNLAKTMDTRGWSSKNATSAYGGQSGSDRLVAAAFYPTAQSTLDDNVEDVYDEENSRLAQNFAHLEAQRAEKNKVAEAPDQALKFVEGSQASAPGSTVQPTAPRAAEQPEESIPEYTAPLSDAHYNPFPSSMRQKVINPLGTDQPASAEKSSPSQPAQSSPDDVQSSSVQPTDVDDDRTDVDLNEGGELKLR